MVIRYIYGMYSIRCHLYELKSRYSSRYNSFYIYVSDWNNASDKWA